MNGFLTILADLARIAQSCALLLNDQKCIFFKLGFGLETHLEPWNESSLAVFITRSLLSKVRVCWPAEWVSRFTRKVKYYLGLILSLAGTFDASPQCQYWWRHYFAAAKSSVCQLVYCGVGMSINVLKIFSRFRLIAVGNLVFLCACLDFSKYKKCCQLFCLFCSHALFALGMMHPFFQ